MHDVSDGGLLVAIAEMALAGGIGVQLFPYEGKLPAHAAWFGEDQGRYVLEVDPELAEEIIERARLLALPVAHRRPRRRRRDRLEGRAAAASGRSARRARSLAASLHGRASLTPRASAHGGLEHNKSMCRGARRGYEVTRVP